MEFRKVGFESITDFFRIKANAFPAFIKNKTQLEKLLNRMEQDNSTSFFYWGAYHNNDLIGVYRFHRFIMNYHGEKIKMGGIGGVAVDLLHKKEHVCKKMISHFLAECKKESIPIASLYSFRPDFYYNMGFGFGAPRFAYKFSLQELPYNDETKQIHFACNADIDKIKTFQNDVVMQKHGMYNRSSYDIDLLKKREPKRVLVFKEKEAILGYCIFDFHSEAKQNNFVNTLQILELEYKDKAVFRAFMSFFKKQMDQVDYATIDSFDPYFYFNLRDFRNGSNNFIHPISHEIGSIGVGLMYYALQPQKLLDLLPNKISNISFEIEEPFVLKKKIIAGKKNADYSVRLNIQTFVSICMGALPIKHAIKKELLHCNEKTKAILQETFIDLESPECLSRF